VDSFEPIINILTVLTVLSVAAERLTNVVKLRQDPSWKQKKGRARELHINASTMIIGVSLAITTKADIFEILTHPLGPWSTLGWTAFDGTTWVRHASATSVSGAVQALLGCSITGFSLGFGSTFWHDTLGIVIELRKLTEKRATARAVPDGGGDV
jgi:hypothetical protein